MGTTKNPTAAGQAKKNKPPTNVIAVGSGDPLQVNQRLYRQIARLLDDIEAADRDDRMTMPQRISALIAVGRIQVLFANLRKASINDGSSGSQVRKYAAAFSSRPHDSSLRASNAGSGGFSERDDDGDDGDDAA